MRFVDKFDDLYFVNGNIDEKSNVDSNNFSFESNFLNIKIFMNFFKIKEEQNNNKYEAEKKIKNCLYKFYDMGIDIEKKSLVELVPYHLIQDHIQKRNEHYSNIIENIKTLNGFSNFIKFYNENREIFDILPKLKKQFSFGNIEFDFAENFRFKTTGDSFNVLNLRKELRDIIKPDDENSFVFVCDYKQFEFRTLLSLIGYDKSIFSDNLYEKLAEQLKLPTEDAKQSLISWMYSERKNSLIDRVLDKSIVMRRLRDGLIVVDDVPVYAGVDADNKILHSIVQTYSQFYYLKRLCNILELLKEKKSCIAFPLHDAMIFFISKDELELVEKIPKLMENDVYKTKKYIGKNFKEIEEI